MGDGSMTNPTTAQEPETAQAGHQEVDALQELLSFLTDSRPEFRKIAVGIVAGQSTSQQSCEQLHGAGFITPLCRLTGDVATVAEDAISALINIAAEVPVAMEDMVNSNISNRVMETVLSKDSPPKLRDLALALVTNVTTLADGARKMMQLDPTQGVLEGLHVRKLTRLFVTSPAKALGGAGGGAQPAAQLDDWQQVASILRNISALEEGRELLRRPKLGILADLLPELSSPNPVRRRGVAGCVRNCCGEDHSHPWLIKELGLIRHLLMPLASSTDDYTFEEKVALDPDLWQDRPGQPPKRRETDAEVRTALYEAILQLCSTPDSRAALRRQGAYFVVREADRAETDEELSQICYQIVNFLQREEADKQGRIEYLKAAMAADVPPENHLPGGCTEISSDSCPRGACDRDSCCDQGSCMCGQACATEAYNVGGQGRELQTTSVGQVASGVGRIDLSAIPSGAGVVRADEVGSEAGELAALD